MTHKQALQKVLDAAVAFWAQNTADHELSDAIRTIDQYERDVAELARRTAPQARC